jgi:hypothetical protein
LSLFHPLSHIRLSLSCSLDLSDEDSISSCFATLHILLCLFHFFDPLGLNLLVGFDGSHAYVSSSCDRGKAPCLLVHVGARPAPILDAQCSSKNQGMKCWRPKASLALGMSLCCLKPLKKSQNASSCLSGDRKLWGKGYWHCGPASSICSVSHPFAGKTAAELNALETKMAVSSALGMSLCSFKSV